MCGLQRHNAVLRLAGAAALLIAVSDAEVRAAAFDVPWAQPSAVDPIAAYGDTISFQVLRNGEPVGQHSVRFTRQGNDVIVSTRFDLQVRVLFITAYRYGYTSTGVWRDGKLVSLTALTNDNGSESRVDARLEGDALKISGPNGPQQAPPGIFPTNHWHPGVVTESQVLNTITGGVNSVRIIDRGVETVLVAGKPQPARRYSYTGELTNEVWYDDNGRWVKMRFQGKDGSTIEYVCMACRSWQPNPV